MSSKQELGHTWVLTSLKDGGGSGGDKAAEDNECERETHCDLQGVMRYYKSNELQW